MSTTMARLAVPAGLFVLAVITGLWLTHAGRPLNAAIMAVHKIAAVVTVIVLSVAVVRLARGASLGAVQVGVMVAAGLIGLLLFASGAWLSIKPVGGVVAFIHKVAPVLTAIATAAAAALLTGGGR